MAYPQPGAPRNHPDGTKVLVLGILSVVLCQILGPFAWSSGNKALREIDASPSSYANRGSVQAGRILGMVASILLILSIVIVVISIFAGAASDSSSLGVVG